MSATTTQLLSSGDFFKQHYYTTPVQSTSANFSFYTNNSIMPKFLVMTFLSHMNNMYVFTMKSEAGTDGRYR